MKICNSGFTKDITFVPLRGAIVPLSRSQLEGLVVDVSEGIEEMGTESGVEVLQGETGWALSVLGPCRHVARCYTA